AQPYARRANLRIKKEDFVGERKNRFDERFLFLASVGTNDPGINNACLAIGIVAVLPLFYVEWRTLKFNGPAPAVGMSYEDVGDAVGFGQTFFQCHGCLWKLCAQPLSEHYFAAHVSY